MVNSLATCLSCSLRINKKLSFVHVRWLRFKELASFEVRLKLVPRIRYSANGIKQRVLCTLSIYSLHDEYLTSKYFSFQCEYTCETCHLCNNISL